MATSNKQAKKSDTELWTPIERDATTNLGEMLVQSKKLESLDSFRKVRTEAIRILEQCLPPSGGSAQKTGLVLGYVQSGKTMSMSTVAALARDNQFRLIIVLAGTKKNLNEQSRSRFVRELRGDSSDIRWKMWDNPMESQYGDELKNLVREWNDSRFAEEDQRALFITVLKQHQRLEHLAKLLETVDLSGIGTLIMDDEADQAGLNTQPTAEVSSTTYRRILRIRACLPRHTYLQYTATPQAPLLISLVDMLSPDFAELLKPGKGYTGGQAFFIERPELICKIPLDETPEALHESIAPPESLQEALRIFFLGVTAAHIEREGNPLRSMLIHPSVRQTSHGQYKRWVEQLQERWRLLLEPPSNDQTSHVGDTAEREEVLDQFKASYSHLKKTVHSIPSFADLHKRLWTMIGRTLVTEVNSETGHEVEWNRESSHILIGGAKLERGYTVEGLIVTYMPRGPGGRNSDVIQQRARFFGYKQNYLGYCRVYLAPEVVDFYRAYVEHEEHIREQLREHRGRSLKEWRRAFYLDRRYRPTRSNVLIDPYSFIESGSGEWFKQVTPHFSDEAIHANRDRLLAFTRGLEWQSWAKYPRIEVAAPVPLKQVMQHLLVEYAFLGERLEAYKIITGLMDLLEKRPKAEVAIFQMPTNEDGFRKRKTRAPEDDRIELHQGHGSGLSVGGYPGDKKVFDPERVSLQIFRLRIEVDGQNEHIEDVPALAIRMPSAKGRTLLVQDKTEGVQS